MYLYLLNCKCGHQTLFRTNTLIKNNRQKCDKCSKMSRITLLEESYA